MIFSGLLRHRSTPEDMVTSALIPIRKGKNVNVTASVNYSGIAL